MERQVVLITGGTDGLGKAVARLLSDSHTVIVLGKDQKKVEQVQDELHIDSRHLDVRNWTQTYDVVQEILAHYGRIDVLVNCAGVWIQGKLEDNSVEHIGMAIDVNLYGTIWLCKAVIPGMITRHTGLIVNVISEDGNVVKPERSIYCASKWGLAGFTKALACDLAPERVRVTGFYPGKMCTSFFEKAGVNRNIGDFLDVEEAAKTIVWVIKQPEHVQIPEVGISGSVS